MKSALIILTVIAVMVGAFFTLRITDERQKAERQRAYCKAIIEILNINRQAIKTRFGNRAPPPFTHYIHDISEFDLSRCPKSFQEAWVDYVASVQKLTNDLNAQRRAAFGRLIEGGLGLIATGGIGATVPAMEGMAKDQAKQAHSTNQDKNALIDSMAKLKKIAIHYGVVFHPEN
jgi:hypothetical protein